MKKSIVLTATLLIVLFTAPVQSFAQPTLSSEAAKSFIDFYFYGQGQGVVLADMKICKEIIENECIDEVSPLALELGVPYMVWMMYVVPDGVEEETILLEYKKDGVTERSSEATVKGSVRYRTWKSFRPNRAGNWDIVITYDKKGVIETLKSVTATVNE